jgi:hypothetical protein
MDFQGEKKPILAWEGNPSAYSGSMTFSKEKIRRERRDPRQRFMDVSMAARLFR